MRIFVTGATGFIGVHLCRRLVQDGHTVLALLRSPDKARLLPAHNMEYLEGDLSIFKNRDLQIPPCDVVVHLAAALKVKDQSEYMKYNYDSVVDMVECLKAQSWQPRRLVFASTLAAGGPSRAGAPLTESDPARPVDSYGQAKLRAEQFLSTAPFPTTCFRPGPVFGPGDSAAVTLFKIAGTGFGFRIAGVNQKLCFIYVADLVDSIVKMIGEDKPDHKIYYVASSEFIDTEIVWKTVGEALGKKLLIINLPRRLFKGIVDFLALLSTIIEFDNQVDQKKYDQMTEPAFLCSNDRLRNELGWKPATDFKTTMRLTAQGYKEQGWI
jgi:nucleoside-diphosphate-sugar epimerase